VFRDLVFPPLGTPGSQLFLVFDLEAVSPSEWYEFGRAGTGEDTTRFRCPLYKFDWEGGGTSEFPLGLWAVGVSVVGDMASDDKLCAGATFSNFLDALESWLRVFA
jgi:hypothetical protein